MGWGQGMVHALRGVRRLVQRKEELCTEGEKTFGGHLVTSDFGFLTGDTGPQILLLPLHTGPLEVM